MDGLRQGMRKDEVAMWTPSERYAPQSTRLVAHFKCRGYLSLIKIVNTLDQYVVEFPNEDRVAINRPLCVFTHAPSLVRGNGSTLLFG